MRNLILFIWKHSFFFLFLILEVVCIYLVVQNNYYQRAGFINSSNALSANLLQTSTNAKQYFYLKNENENLAKENAALRAHVINAFNIINNKEYTIRDSTYHQQFTYTSAKVVNISTNRRNNFMTLNKGYKQGIGNNMAVITSTGVVGQVKDVSENFCTVMSLLHSKTTISAKIKKDGSYGPLTWEGGDFQYATLQDIPTHVRLAKGDTIVTSAYSRTFPENILIGTVESFEREPGKYFYTIKVQLSTDFKKLTYVYIVKNIYKEEQEELEKRSEKEAKE